jgi:GTPase SAR1 family protein
MSGDRLLERTVAMCREARTETDGALRTIVGDILEALESPLRVALIGRVKAGKSTLLNALVGERVAPTAASECTQVVTWFRKGPAKRAELVCLDGHRRSLTFEKDGTLPAHLEVPLHDVKEIQVELTSEQLNRITLVDTPGLQSANVELSDRTDAMLGIDASTEAARQADAILYVYEESVHQSDVETLAAFKAVSGDLSASALNAVAVLTRIDQLSSGEDDGWHGRAVAAERLAESHRRVLQNLVADVIPVSGLLAESVETGRLGEDEADIIRTTARGTPAQRHAALLTRNRWESDSADWIGAVEDRRRLFGLLEIAGLQLAVDDALRSGEPFGGAALCDLVLTASGLSALRSSLTDRFDRRSDLLKASRGLSGLADAARQHATAQGSAWLLNQIDELSASDDAFVLRELAMLEQVSSERVSLGATHRAAAQLLLSGLSPHLRLALPDDASWSDVRSAAEAASVMWHTAGLRMADPRARMLAADLARSADLLAKSCMER